MKSFELFKKKKKKSEKNLIIKNGKNDVRVYPKETLLASMEKQEKKQN